jgi:hypothetical protein
MWKRILVEKYANLGGTEGENKLMRFIGMPS